jgi:hypothetical protein
VKPLKEPNEGEVAVGSGIYELEISERAPGTKDKEDLWDPEKKKYKEDPFLKDFYKCLKANKPKKGKKKRGGGKKKKGM